MLSLNAPGPALCRQKCDLSVSQRLCTPCLVCWWSCALGCYPVMALFSGEQSLLHTLQATKANISTSFKLMEYFSSIYREAVETLTRVYRHCPIHKDQTMPRGQHKLYQKCYLPREATGHLLTRWLL